MQNGENLGLMQVQCRNSCKKYKCRLCSHWDWVLDCCLDFVLVCIAAPFPEPEINSPVNIRQSHFTFINL